jgi:hypothetical protein
MDSDLLPYVKKEEQKLEEMKTQRNKRKKEVAEVFDSYFKPLGKYKIERFNDIFSELGWGITEDEYEKIEKAISSDLRDYLNYKIAKERYYYSIIRNRKEDN